MRQQLQRRNLDILGDIEIVIQAIKGTYTPDVLLPYKAQLLTVAEQLRLLVQQNLRYLQLGQVNILDDILSRTQQIKRTFDLLSTQLTTPILRFSPTDELPLATIAWQHSVHKQAARFPAVFTDGPWAIWPFLAMGLPLYYVPSAHQRGLRFLALLFHEFGHLLYLCHKQELDDLVTELMETVAETLHPISQRNDRYAEDQVIRRQMIVKTWYRWAQELFCDAVGFTIGGPCYIHAFSSYVNPMHSGDFYQQPQDMALSSHPVTWLRIRFLTERANTTGFTTLAAEVDREWRGFARMMRIVEDYHGFYHERLHRAITQTLEDMLTEVSPRPYTQEEAAGGGWCPTSDSPIRLLNWAWQMYLNDPDHYAAWEVARMRQFIEARSAAQAIP